MKALALIGLTVFMSFCSHAINLADLKYENDELKISFVNEGTATVSSKTEHWTQSCLYFSNAATNKKAKFPAVKDNRFGVTVKIWCFESEYAAAITKNRQYLRLKTGELLLAP